MFGRFLDLLDLEFVTLALSGEQVANGWFIRFCRKWPYKHKKARWRCLWYTAMSNAFN